MTFSSSAFARTAFARTVFAGAALSLALGVASEPAYARGGDITRGVIMGLATGVILDQMSQNNWGRGYADQYYSYPETTYYYAPPRHYERSYYYVPRHRYYYAPSYSYVQPASPLSRAFRSQDRQLRMSIQYRLMQAGYYNAGIDGLWGPATQSALYGYARDNGELAMLTNVGDANRLFSDILR